MHCNPVEVVPSEAKRIAYAYQLAADGDARAALVHAIDDALTDLAEAERRSLRSDRLISRGFDWGGVPLTGPKA
ncbi:MULTISPECIES: hypothetical protein [Methylobacterium]|uniref:Uncharacterized protein n=1 Tax=Methylobacterium hispanicum TaxID=270350 RepID=A0AAV4ZGA4_9HYPH|nr:MULTISPECIES: hypothetical protein [Methylobacterium]GJD87439.1 hypothetical protein BHAOGJBA_0942 [Methylobacterium hispanicum]